MKKKRETTNLNDKKLSNFLTENKIIEDCLKGKEQPSSFLDSLLFEGEENEKFKRVYIIKGTSYNAKTNTVSSWDVNNRIFASLQDANRKLEEIETYNLTFGNIYENPDYLREKLLFYGRDLTLKKLGFSAVDIEGVLINPIGFDRYLNNSPDIHREKIPFDSRVKSEFIEKVKSAKLLFDKEYREILKTFKMKNDKILSDLEITEMEIYYLITFCRFHPDSFFGLNALGFEADYKLDSMIMYKSEGLGNLKRI